MALLSCHRALGTRFTFPISGYMKCQAHPLHVTKRGVGSDLIDWASRELGNGSRCWQLAGNDKKDGCSLSSIFQGHAIL